MKHIDYDEVKQLWDKGLSIKAISREVGVSYPTLAKRCEEWGMHKQPYEKGNWEADISLDYELCDAGMERLVCAIIESAVFDYMKALKRGEHPYLEERFFHSDWFSDLTMMTPMEIDTDKVLEGIKERLKNEKNIRKRQF